MSKIKVSNLKKYFQKKSGVIFSSTSSVKAVDDISFEIGKGETLSIIGESGCGKTTLGKTMLGLLKPTEGEIFFDGKDITDFTKSENKNFRKKVGIVFQNPGKSLNPRRTVEEVLKRPMKIHSYSEKEIDKKIKEVLDDVRLREEHLKRYPHELSGGQQQRVAIGRELVTDPEFILLDEPTSALDVSVQAEILNLLIELKKKKGLTYLFITHNLNLGKYISDRVGVMYVGKIVEIGDESNLFEKPLHPYTFVLLNTAPTTSPEEKIKEEYILGGEPPDPSNPPSGCNFNPRCPYSKNVCKNEEPNLEEVKGRKVSCHFAGDLDF